MNPKSPQHFAAPYANSLFIDLQQALALIDSQMMHCLIEYDLAPAEFIIFTALTLFELAFIDMDVELPKIIQFAIPVLTG